MAIRPLLPPITLLDGVTADDPGTAVPLATPHAGRYNALYSCHVEAVGDDFGSGGVVTVQVSPDGVSWFVARTLNDNQAIFTASDILTLHILSPWVKAKLVGSTSPGALTVRLI